MKVDKRLVVFLISILLIVGSSAALAGVAPRTIGLGDEFAALTGLEALYGNPAALNIDNGVFKLDLNIGASFWNNLLINDYIDESTKDRLLGRIKKSGFVMDARGNLGGELSIGPITGFAGVKALAVANLSEDMASVVLKGNEIGREYSLDGSAAYSATYLDAGVNYAMELPDSITESLPVSGPSYLGMTYHYLRGMAIKGSGSGSFMIDYGEEEPVLGGSSGDFTFIHPEDEDDTGSGSAFDLGVYTEVDDTYTLGLSVMNIGGSLSIDKARYYKYEMVYDEETEEWEFTDQAEEGNVAGGLTVKLPLIVRVGGSMKVSDTLLLLANYSNTSYPKEIFGKTLRDNKIAVGAEWTGIGFLPLRAGVNYSTLARNLELSAGMGLDLGPLKAEIGISDLSGLFNQAKGASGSLCIGLEF